MVSRVVSIWARRVVRGEGRWVMEVEPVERIARIRARVSVEEVGEKVRQNSK